MFIVRIELRVEIGICQMLHNILDIPLLGQPTIKNFMTHTDTEGVYTQEQFGFLVEGDGNA